MPGFLAYVMRMQKKPVLTALLATLIAFTPVSAFAKTWWDEDGMSILESMEGRFEFMQHDMNEPIVCKIYDWPISNPVATLTCDDNVRRTLEVIDMEAVIFDGIVMSTTRPF